MSGWILKMLISERRAGVMRLIDEDEIHKEERRYILDDKMRDVHHKAFQFFCLWQKSCAGDDEGSQPGLPDWQHQWDSLSAEERQSYLALALLLVKTEPSQQPGLRIWDRKIKKSAHSWQKSKGKGGSATGGEEGHQTLLFVEKSCNTI